MPLFNYDDEQAKLLSPDSEGLEYKPSEPKFNQRNASDNHQHILNTSTSPTDINGFADIELTDVSHHQATSPLKKTPTVAELFAKLLGLLPDLLSKKSKTSLKGIIIENFNKNTKANTLDKEQVTEEFKNILTVVLQRDRNRWSLFSETTTGKAVLKLLETTEFRLLRDLLPIPTKQKLAYKDLIIFATGKNDTSQFSAKNSNLNYQKFSKYLN